MNTILKKIDKDNIDYSVMEMAGEILRRGEMVAFPTETVYGLGANALDESASAKIYEAKGRPSDNPLIVHISKEEQLEPLVKEIPEKARLLMEKFWPGPLTLIFKKKDTVPDGTTGGLDTVAIRMPDNAVALAMIDAAKVPIAAPSANTSGRPSPTTANHVMDDMNGRISMILDGGAVGIGIESTRVDVTGEIPMILRPGYINKSMLENVVGEVAIDKAILGPMDENSHPKAPGMKYKHYAPKADFTMYDGDIENVIKAINKRAKDYIDKGYTVGIICSDETRQNEITISHNLYRILRDFDDKEVDYILGETFNTKELGGAIMNRLLKAAGYQVENV